MTSVTSPLSTASSITPTPPVAAAAPSPSPVVSGATLGQAQDAVDLTTEEGVVSFLGGASPAVTTYDAAGLLNSFVEAGTSATLSSSPTSAAPSTDSSLIGSLSGGTGTGYLPPSTSGTGTDINADWSSILPSQPGLTGDVVADSFNQGIVSTLSAYA